MFQLLNRRGIYAVVFLLLGMLIFPAMVSAQVPSMMHYQGRLTDTLGIAMDTEVGMTFTLFSDSLGSTAVWSETHDKVAVEDGLFGVLLGSTNPLNGEDFTGAALWLGIAVAGGDVMMPLTPMVSTAYAFGSSHAEHAATSGHADTAAVALSSATGGWKDLGSVVTLTTLGDSVGIGTENPATPLQVKSDGSAIFGHSLGSGNAYGVYGGNDHDGVGVFGVSDGGKGVQGYSPGGFGGHFSGLKNYFFGDIGVGTETPDEMMHLYTDQPDSNSFMKIHSAHVSNWGAAGVQFATPENTWYLRMGNQGSMYVLPGALGLHQIGENGDVMTWTSEGNVGINDATPQNRLDVVGNNSETAIRGHSINGIGIYGSSNNGYGGYFSAPKHCFWNKTGFNTDDPTHTVTINGSFGLQNSGTTEYHIGYYNGGLDFVETSVADYRLFIKDGGNVGIGTGNPTEKLHVDGNAYVNGNAHVAGTFHADDFETDAIDHTNIVDEIGIASRASSSYDQLSTTYTPYLTREITVPAAGYILAIGWASITLDHGISGNSMGRIVFSEMTDNEDGGRPADFYLASDVGAGWYRCAIPCQRIFYAPAAGTYTYYMIAKRHSDNEAKIYHRQMDLLFIPTVYSSKDGQLTGLDDNISHAISNDSVMEATIFAKESASSDAPPVSTQDTGDRVDALESRMNALMTEMETIQRELSALKESR